VQPHFAVCASICCGCSAVLCDTVPPLVLLLVLTVAIFQLERRNTSDLQQGGVSNLRQGVLPALHVATREMTCGRQMCTS
jgi:hypothetical protein